MERLRNSDYLLAYRTTERNGEGGEDGIGGVFEKQKTPTVSKADYRATSA